MRRRACQVLLLVLVVLGSPVRAEDGAIRVFAAASLSQVLDQLNPLWIDTGGDRLVVSAAGSGVLARQVLAGAPADVYLSADPAWVDLLVDRQLITADDRHTLLSNRLVLVAPAGQPYTRHDVLDARALRDTLATATRADPRARVAIGLVDAVPAGRYANEALHSFGVQSLFANRLVEADNVQATLRLVARGEAALGFVYASDALAEPRVQVIGVIDDSAHSPIEYVLAQLDDSDRTGRFVDWLMAPAARAVLRGAGFIVPPDALD